ncbi:sensor domain-containing diguanylate cyclase [Venatoribacter cucullus]|uniref:sensor domain-containing diguanylate cyclase n=1 Tax=Venatoribacter cucullus TaxID=2661630 RepID=UPI0022408A05|nr:sensor domain-containing diguanylate cyclase [Venatoribacter cucullus]UZK03520.1 diguanylate cyclase [Venatoribacter cucullus]
MPESPQDTNQHAMTTILDSLDALVYVADMDTHELLFLNEYGRSKWGMPAGRRCWEVLQKNQQGPCAFCTNHHLRDAGGNSSGVHVWEFQNTVTGRWFQCRDQAIRWVDGRLVRLEIATDITDRKQTEQALEEARIKAQQLADTDVLTHMNNRRAFFKLGEQLLLQAHRFGQPACLIMFDLDFFKQINDNHGHAAGDAVLVQIAQLCTSNIRDADIAARLGGEEFAILLPQTDYPQALNLATRLHNAIANNPTAFNGQQLPCTASFGVTCTDHWVQAGNSMPVLDELLNAADQRLFSVKRNGRNGIA